MVGLPYPNPSDPELRERMRFMDHAAHAASAAGVGAPALPAAAAASLEVPAGLPAAGPTQGPRQQPCQQQPCQQQGQGMCREDGRAYYANLCAKAVNQCLGRVIRHRGDWAAVLLADARWVGGWGPGRGVVGASQAARLRPRGLGQRSCPACWPACRIAFTAAVETSLAAPLAPSLQVGCGGGRAGPARRAPGQAAGLDAAVADGVPRLWRGAGQAGTLHAGDVLCSALLAGCRSAASTRSSPTLTTNLGCLLT